MRASPTSNVIRFPTISTPARGASRWGSRSGRLVPFPAPLPPPKKDGPWVIVVNGRRHCGYSCEEAMGLFMAGKCERILTYGGV